MTPTEYQQKVDQFFATWSGKGINFDNSFGNQCVDVYRQYVLKVLGFPQSPPVKGASDIWDTYLKDKFDRFDDTNDFLPQKGDIGIWSNKAGGGFGHVGIFNEGNLARFTSFDQNWPSEGYYDPKGNFVGTGVCHLQEHNYINVLGWLRPKNLVLTPVPPASTPIPIGFELIKTVDLIALREKEQELNVISATVKTLEAEIKRLNDLLATPPPFLTVLIIAVCRHTVCSPNS